MSGRKIDSLGIRQPAIQQHFHQLIAGSGLAEIFDRGGNSDRPTGQNKGVLLTKGGDGEIRGIGLTDIQPDDFGSFRNLFQLLPDSNGLGSLPGSPGRQLQIGNEIDFFLGQIRGQPQQVFDLFQSQ